MTQLDEFLAKFSPDVEKVARAALGKLRRRLRGATQLVYDNYNALAIAFSTTGARTDIILSVALYPRWVSLFFMRGATLPDPKHVLKGGGSTVRHIVLEKASDLDKPAVAALIDAAVKRANPPLDPSRREEVVVKMALPRTRSRRPRA
jgi:hypothetical protein